MNRLIKILSFLCGCFIIFLIAVSSNSEWFDKWSAYAQSPKRFGDLYVYTNMHEFRTPISRDILKAHTPVQKNNISLTLLGDSFMRYFDSTSFAADQYRFVHWNNAPDTIPPLNRNKTNILIITSVERYCRLRLLNTRPIYIGEKKNKSSEAVEIKLNAESKLQYILTNMDWALPFKELKTAIYLKWFHKFDRRVAWPDSSGRLYLDETVNPEIRNSGFNPIDENEINTMVNSSNEMYENAKRLGFDKVYFSLFPNSSSLYYSSRFPYNNLIERVQENPNFKVPIIDAYHLLKKQTQSVFYCNDAHWNEFGEVLWLTNVNALLKKEK